MRIISRLHSAWLVLIGRKYASSYPPKGIKRNRNKNQKELPFRMVEGGEG